MTAARLISLALLLGPAACTLKETTKDACSVSRDCDGGRACALGRCVDDRALREANALPAEGSPPECAQPDGPVRRYSTEGELRALLVGRWLRCSGERIGPEDQVGLELTWDGHAYVLARDPGGAIVRGSGFLREGDVRVVDTSATGGAGSFQINLDWAGSGGTLLSVAFADGPRKMMLNHEGRLSFYVSDGQPGGGSPDAAGPGPSDGGAPDGWSPQPDAAWPGPFDGGTPDGWSPQPDASWPWDGGEQPDASWPSDGGEQPDASWPADAGPPPWSDGGA